MGVLPNHPFLGYSTPHFRKPAYMAYHLPRLFYNDPPHLRAERACRFRRTGNPRWGYHRPVSRPPWKSKTNHHSRYENRKWQHNVKDYNWLVVSTPLKHMKVSWDYYPNIWKKTCFKTQTKYLWTMMNKYNTLAVVVLFSGIELSYQEW